MLPHLAGIPALETSLCNLQLVMSLIVVYSQCAESIPLVFMSHGGFWRCEAPLPSMRLDVCVTLQVAGVRSNLWPGAAAVASGAAFTNVYVGWGVKTGPFLPLPPPPVAQEYDQVGSGHFSTPARATLYMLHAFAASSIKHRRPLSA